MIKGDRENRIKRWQEEGSCQAYTDTANIHCPNECLTLLKTHTIPVEQNGIQLQELQVSTCFINLEHNSYFHIFCKIKWESKFSILKYFNQREKKLNKPNDMSLFVGKEKPGRIVIFLGALRRKHVILILMYCLLSAIKKKSSGCTRWKDISWHLLSQDISSLASLTYVVFSVCVFLSFRKKLFLKVPQIKNVKHSSLITLSQLRSLTNNP